MNSDKTKNALAVALRMSNLKVVEVNSPFEVVINRGSDDGLRDGQLVLIYAVGKEITDPDTLESLGRLEIVRGKGRIVHLQTRIATVQNIERVKTQQFGLFGPSTEEAPAPFRNAAVGDLARLIN